MKQIARWPLLPRSPLLSSTTRPVGCLWPACVLELCTFALHRLLASLHGCGMLHKLQPHTIPALRLRCCCCALQGRPAQQLGVVAQQVQAVVKQHGAEDWNIVKQDPQVCACTHLIAIPCSCAQGHF